jgi:regulator of chromosome condensation
MHTVALSSEGEVWTWGVNDEGCLGRATEGTSWEDAAEADKGAATVPGRAKLPGAAKACQVRAEGWASIWALQQKEGEGTR